MQLPPRRQFLRLAAGAAALPALPQIARAQAYPSRPITIIAPFPPGGGSDAIGRIIAERMRATLGQPVIIENVVGANGSIGSGRVTRAAADGYTLVLANWNTHVANGAVYQLQYDLMADFEPVALVASNPYLVVTRKSMPANALRDLIDWLKANSGKATMGTAGIGSPGHVGGVFFQNTTDTRFQFVPYRGDGPAMQDLVGGQTDMMISSPTAAVAQVRSGNIKAYAVTAKSRLPAAPDIPTVDEAGLPGFYLSNWYALFGPKGTPKIIVNRLNAAVVDALADSVVRSRLSDQGQEIPTSEQQTPDALAIYQKAEIEKWWPIIKAANIKGE
ncbi:MAG TPA: tripartite tricarboxylate transporter substrate-binding protein [Xanthobacteraceae bacterium]|jgi:tripartite-type tricarboxylate transporter receptor subunit TctC|nr:tripartite tricarboxylate transporter substrate-binding protein [Xanthobacteraceae bacterium]